ncbi:MAG: magnesium/cobalt transporter CorA [Gammaproteobacteria bacterium]|jgi:magnesium transporter
MIRSLLYDKKAQTLTEGGREAIDAWRKNPDTVIWVDLQDEAAADERELLENEFRLHRLAVHDATRDRHPPKMEEFDDNLFVLLRGLDKDTSDINFGVLQLALFVGERFLVTRHNKESVSTDAIWDDVLAQSPAAMKCDTVAVNLLNRVVRRFIDVLLSLEPRLDELEHEIFANPSDQLLAELTGYKSRLRQLRRIANYHLQIAADLRSGRQRLISDELTHEIADVYEQLERSLSLAQLYYESACDLTDGYLASASHSLNRVMQILTIFTVMFVPLTFLAGIYGMNFENMPELHSSSGYFIVIGVMVVIVFAQLVFFRRKQWI